MVPVALGARAYDIVIGRGVLASLGERVKALRAAAPRPRSSPTPRSPNIISPATEAALAAAGIECSRIVVPPGEASKSYATLRDGVRSGHRARASSAAISWSRSAAA